MSHLISEGDRGFLRAFEAGDVRPADFSHRAHIRLAYIYLSEHRVDAAHQLMRQALLSFLKHHGIEAAKYHETMTRAWIMAVRHFMEKTAASESADAFIEQNPRMLDAKIMMTHYSASVLFSIEARAQFVEPNLDPIPKYTK